MSDEEGQRREPGDGLSRFTVIEWLVAVGILVVLLIALPQFTKLRDKAKEAEVKRNLHSIQLALERYGIDHLDKHFDRFPSYIYGGDAYFNLGTSVALGGKVTLPFWRQAVNPFDENFPDEYKRHGALGSPTAKFGDPLISAGYLTSYPHNPFVNERWKKWFGKDGVLTSPPDFQGFIGCGGADGDAMFNVGWLGEFPAINIYKKSGDPNALFLDFPGQFFYSADYYRDGGTPTEHNAAEAARRRLPDVTPPGAAVEEGRQLGESVVRNYVLIGIGSQTDEGMDVDWSVAWPGVGGGERHAFREGHTYYGPRNSFNAIRGFRPRDGGDGYGDFYIIILQQGTGPD